MFRNLDGTGTLHAEVLPEAGTLRTRVRLVDVSRSGGTIIERFEVECRLGDVTVYSMKTVFGFFLASAFEQPAGLPTTGDGRRAFAEASDFRVDLTERPEPYFSGSLRLPGRRLLMLDRIDGYWPEGGRAGLGRLRAVKDVDPGEWFFKAHFFQDPVQPGSLGLEAMV